MVAEVVDHYNCLPMALSVHFECSKKFRLWNYSSNPDLYRQSLRFYLCLQRRAKRPTLFSASSFSVGRGSPTLLIARFVITIIIDVMTYGKAETDARCQTNKRPQTDILCCNSDCGSDCNSYTHTNHKAGFVIAFLVVILIHKSTSLYPDWSGYFTLAYRPLSNFRQDRKTWLPSVPSCAL